MKKEHDFSKGNRGAVVPNRIKARWIREWIGNDIDRMNFNRYVYIITDFLNEKLKVKHVDMDKTNNSKDNLFITKQRGHRTLQYSFNRLCKSLLEANLIYFDKKRGEYGLRK